MKRHAIRDIARNFTSRQKFLYMIAVLRQLGGVEPRLCNLCGYEGLFHALGHPPRYDCVCLGCYSRERHRLFGLLLAERPDLGTGRVVHWAPEAEDTLVRILKARADRYETADIAMPGCDLRLDIEKIALPDASVDLFVANQLLEHVDDGRALAELYRCLKLGGTALLTTPVVEGWAATYENPEVAHGPSDRERTRHFAYPDHLRFYGRDVRDRIRAAGFELAERTGTPEEILRHGLVRGETVFIARKPAYKG